MRLIDADKAKEQITQMQILKPSERVLLRLALDRTPTYEPPNPPLALDGCKYCADSDGISPLDWMYGLDHIFPNYRFCPMCGREFSRGPEK